MKINGLTGIVCFLISATNAFALDSACNPIVTTSEARMKLAAWHSFTVVNSSTQMEFMKAGGKFFKKIGGEWSLSPISFDTTERDMLAQIRSGEIKLTQCKSAGSDVVDGIPVNVVSYRIEMSGAPAADSKLYIGKSDGLPYRQAGKRVEVTYKYKNITAPKL